jgi:N-acetylneuraminic acid mutarotase
MFESEVIDSKIYIVGSSWNSDNEIITPTEVYDPTTNKWRKLASMPTARFGFQTVVVDDKMYVIGGKNLDNMQFVSSAEVYDSSTNKWTTLATMPVALWDANNFKAEVVDGKIYVVGNIPDGTCTSITEVYDPSTNTWAVLTPMTTPRSGFQTEVIDGKIYAIGGYSGRLIIGPGCDSSIDSISSAEVYDPSTDKWTTLASMSITRCWFQTEVINGEIYAIGGHNVKVGDSEGKSLSSTEVYDPSTDKWTTLASMSTVRRAFQTEVVDDKIYAFGGFDTYNLDLDNELLSVEVYDPSTNKWTTLASMSKKGIYLHTEVIDKVIYAIGAMKSTPMESYTVPTNATK